MESSHILKAWLKVKVLNLTWCDWRRNQFEGLVNQELKLYAQKFENFYRLEKDLDEFYFTDVDLKKFSDLSFSMKVILTLSHGQSALERSFHISNSVLHVSIREELIKAKHLLRAIWL